VSPAHSSRARVSPASFAKFLCRTAQGLSKAHAASDHAELSRNTDEEESILRLKRIEAPVAVVLEVPAASNEREPLLAVMEVGSF
jgi:hypothetical protein